MRVPASEHAPPGCQPPTEIVSGARVAGVEAFRPAVVFCYVGAAHRVVRQVRREGAHAGGAVDEGADRVLADTGDVGQPVIARGASENCRSFTLIRWFMPTKHPPRGSPGHRRADELHTAARRVAGRVRILAAPRRGLARSTLLLASSRSQALRRPVSSDPSGEFATQTGVWLSGRLRRHGDA